MFFVLYGVGQVVSCKKAMKLYHASSMKLEIGQVIESDQVSSSYPKATQCIDSQKPVGFPSREAAIYCSDSEEFAVFFRQKQGNELSEINLYEVEVNDFHKAPFAITHAVEDSIQKQKNPDNLVREYWKPRSDWNFYEYLVL